MLSFIQVYHTSSRNAFCEAWRKSNGKEGEILFNRIGLTKAAAFIQQSIPRGPTASSYLAYLQSSNMADSIYAFTNRLDHGAKDAFIKIYPDIERERHLALTGDSTTEYLYHTAFDEYVTQKKEVNTDIAPEDTLGRRVLQANEQGGISGQTAMEDLQLEANIFDWFGRLFKRLFFISDDQDEAEEEAPAPSTQELESSEQEQGAAQASRAGGTPSFSSRTQGGGGGTGGKCAAEGDMAKVCGASGKGLPKECCATTVSTTTSDTADTSTTSLICDPNGSGMCVANLGSYGGGEVGRGLIMESPGWLVHKDSSRASAQAVDAAIAARKKRRMRGRVPVVGGLLESATSFLGGMLKSMGL